MPVIPDFSMMRHYVRGGQKVAVAQIHSFRQVGDQLYFRASFYEPRFLHETSKTVSLGQTARHCVGHAHVSVLERCLCCSYEELFCFTEALSLLSFSQMLLDRTLMSSFITAHETESHDFLAELGSRCCMLQAEFDIRQLYRTRLDPGWHVVQSLVQRVDVLNTDELKRRAKDSNTPQRDWFYCKSELVGNDTLEMVGCCRRIEPSVSVVSSNSVSTEVFLGF